MAAAELERRTRPFRRGLTVLRRAFASRRIDTHEAESQRRWFFFFFFKFHCTCDRIKHSSYDADDFQERTTSRKKHVLSFVPYERRAGFRFLLFTAFLSKTLLFRITLSNFSVLLSVFRFSINDGDRRSSNHGGSAFILCRGTR